ncbi:MAG: T9SS type A sorting domain-containing protein, partial [Elusimicrobiota bacterium]
GITTIFLLSFFGSIGNSHAADKRTNKLYELYNSTSTPASQKPRLKHFINRRERIEQIRGSSRAARQRALSTPVVDKTGGDPSVGAVAADPTFKLGNVYAYPNPAVGVKHPVIHIEVGLADKVEIKVYNNIGKLVEEAVLTETPKIIKGVYSYEYKFVSDNTPYGTCSYIIRVFKSGFEPIDASGKMMFINTGF